MRAHDEQQEQKKSKNNLQRQMSAGSSDIR